MPVFDPPAYRVVSTFDQRVSGLLFEAKSNDPGSPLVLCVHGIGSNSHYFNLQSNSLAKAAAERGMAALLIDRPGYGGSLCPSIGSAIDSGVEAIKSLLQAIRAQSLELSRRPLVLIGHSFGGAIALSYASEQPLGSLAAICVSGIGDLPTALYLEERQRQISAGMNQLSPHWFFGPGNTFDRHGVTALRPATEPNRVNEAYEVAYEWPKRWDLITAEISCPIHFRLAEFERIWAASPSDLKRMAAAFAQAAYVDAAILPAGGHLYEAHIRGHELVAAQLDFANKACRDMT